MTEYVTSAISKINELAVKAPLVEEHNVMGSKFRNKKITPREWALFQVEWRIRFQVALHNVVKDRTYIEDMKIK